MLKAIRAAGTRSTSPAPTRRGDPELHVARASLHCAGEPVATYRQALQLEAFGAVESLYVLVAPTLAPVHMPHELTGPATYASEPDLPVLTLGVACEKAGEEYRELGVLMAQFQQFRAAEH